ncbi:flagellinolysin [Bacillus sp. BRMEA1]|uniref:flagellinolysin n=1 Tax=Neobacillus endophyticus TaxID=2738405 RepID=UPI0015636F48|nr:flagellinolysin [Neobacillus endophyticus]NRD77349.1 flagellinolysin [Neobacillus endophyticus]
MIINHNSTALNTLRQLNINSNNQAKSMQKLSSGLRINTAADDAAGLAISENMRGQIRGLAQATRNAQDGISMLQTADGALSETQSLLQRGRELSVQASNDTNTAQDRQSIQAEMDQITKQIDRISSSTQFNTINLLNVSSASASSQQNALDGLQKGWLQAAVDLVQKTYGIGGNGQTINVVLDNSIDGPGGTLAYVSDSFVPGVPGPGSNLQLHIDLSDFNNSAFPDGGSPIAFDRVLAHEMTHAAMDASINVATGMPTWFMEGSAEATIGADERLSADLTAVGGAQNLANLIGNGTTTWTQDSQHYSMGYAAVRYMDSKIKAAGGTGVKDLINYMKADTTKTLDDAITNATHGAFANLSDFVTKFTSNAPGGGVDYITNQLIPNLGNADTGALTGSDATGNIANLKDNQTIVDETPYGTTNNTVTTYNVIWPTITASNNGPKIHIGANSNENMSVNLFDASAKALGVDSIDVVNNAQAAIKKFDAGIQTVSNYRATMGALQNRLEHVLSVNQQSEENLTDAESRIRDVDMAKEMMNQSKSSILAQAAQTMLAQATQQPQQVLQLLRA